MMSDFFKLFMSSQPSTLNWGEGVGKILENDQFSLLSRRNLNFFINYVFNIIGHNQIVLKIFGIPLEAPTCLYQPLSGLKKRWTSM